MTARTLMVQGTASDVGKSVLVTALCRIFHRQGVRVAPFKAQNMALCAAVTPEGHEIGRAQAVQAKAAGLTPCVEMSPVLLKPEGDGRSQLVLLGRPAGSFAHGVGDGPAPALREAVAESLRTLRAQHDLILLEGAGSPAEPNLRDRDVSNMHAAALADAPVLLVGDIDRGGVFASLYGTLALLRPEERARVRGLIVNKLRGEASLLADAVAFLEARADVPVLGVVPFLRDLGLPDEDATSLDARACPPRAPADAIEIAVVRLPTLSNHDDFLPLEREPGVVVRYVDAARELAGADLVVVPGSKSTVHDLAWLRRRGLARALCTRAQEGAPVLGICGGCQMLGEIIEDPAGVESRHASTLGLGLLPLRTRFAGDKRTELARGVLAATSFLGPAGAEVEGYEMHMGRVVRGGEAPPTAWLGEGKGTREDGAVDASGTVVGTMLHGLFEAPAVRSSLLAFLRARAGIAAPAASAQPEDPMAPFDRLADAVEEALDMEALWTMIGGRP